MPDQPTWDELNQQRQALEQRRDELMQQQTPREEVTQVNNAVDQIREVLSATSGDASEVKDKIEQHLGDLREASATVRDALNDARIQELTEGITGGLDTASSMLEAADEALGPIDEALDALQSALELADAQPAEQLDALASALEAATERLGPLIERIPGLGQFFELYVLAIRNIANSVGQIQAVQTRLQRIWSTVRPGTQMYLVPRTAQERLADEIRDLDRQIAAIGQQMIDGAQAARESAEDSDETPEPEVVVRSAENRCQDERVPDNSPELRARNDAWHEYEAAEERWSAASGQYDLAGQDVDRAESALSSATSPGARQGSANLDQLRADVEGAHSARDSAAEILGETEAAYDESATSYRAAQTDFDAVRQHYIDCVKSHIIGLIPYANQGRGFSDSDFRYLAAIYPQYALTPDQYEAAQPAPATTPTPAPAAPPTPQPTGILDRIRAHPIVSGLLLAGALALTFGALTLGGGDPDDATNTSPTAQPTSTTSQATGSTAATASPTSAAATTEATTAAAPSLAALFMSDGAQAQQSIAGAYTAGYAPISGVTPDWADSVAVRLLRGDDGIVYIDITAPADILRTLCGEVDLLQGGAHLDGDFDFCAEGATAPGYFQDIRHFNPTAPSEAGHLTICTGITTAEQDISFAIWLFKVNEDGSYEAVELTASAADIPDAPPGTDFSESFQP